MYVNALPPIDGMDETGTMENLSVLNYAREHPVMRYLNPATVKVGRAMQATLPPGALTLITATEGPLVADVSGGNQRVIWIAFDIAQSDWPWNLSFPLFFQNLVSWVPRTAVDSTQGIPAGSPLAISAPPEVAEVTVTRPDGSTALVPLAASGPSYYGETETAGIYRVRYGDVERDYAVNLLDRGESSIAPADAVALGAGEVVAVARKDTQNRELWPWFVMVALGVLLAEWWIYSRRAWM